MRGPIKEKGSWISRTGRRRSFGCRAGDLFEAIPIARDGAVASVLYLVSDRIAQQSEGGEGWKWKRGIRYSAYGLLDGCISHVWFGKLDQVVEIPSLPLATCTKVTLDLLLFTPVWCAAFLSFMAVLDGKDAGKRVKEEWLELYIGNVLAWLPANVVIYVLVPLQLRVISFGTYNLFYTTVLSFWAEGEKANATKDGKRPVEGSLYEVLEKISKKK